MFPYMIFWLNQRKWYYHAFFKKKQANLFLKRNPTLIPILIVISNELFGISCETALCFLLVMLQKLFKTSYFMMVQLLKLSGYDVAL